MKLFTRTLAGTGVSFDVALTGQLREDGEKILLVEVMLPIGGGFARFDQKHVVPSEFGNRIVARSELLPTSPGGRQLLWVNPQDLYTKDGLVEYAQLRSELARVNEQRRADMLRGPLGENWP